MMSSQQYVSNKHDDDESVFGEDSIDYNKLKIIVGKKPLFPGFGMICAVLSAAIYSCGAIIVKMVDLHPTQLSLSRCAVQFLILLPLMYFKHKTVDILGPPGFRVLLWMRGFIGSSGLIFFYIGINEFSVGNAVTLSYLNIVMVPFVAWIFIKEKINIFDVIFVFVSLGGVVLISKPTFLFPVRDIEDQSSVLGVICCILAAICTAFSIVFVRKLGPVTYPALNIFYFSFCGSLTITITLIIIDEFSFPCWSELPLVFLLGVLGLLGQIFSTLALQTERAAVVSVLFSTQIIFVYIMQVAIFGDIPSVLSLVGASLILTCSIGIGAQKYLNERKRRKNKDQT